MPKKRRERALRDTAILERSRPPRRSLERIRSPTRRAMTTCDRYRTHTSSQYERRARACESVSLSKRRVHRSVPRNAKRRGVLNRKFGI